jgi:type VI secretion system protein VasD
MSTSQVASRFLGVVVGASLAGLLFGCSRTPPAESAEPCDKQVLTLGVLATPHLNPEETGESRPVVLRIYQLKTDVGFRNATFEKIWKQDQEGLGKDLLAKQELTVFPNSVQSLDFERNPEANYFVAAGLFRDPKGRQWYSVLEMPPAPGEESCLAKCAGDQCAQAIDPNPKIYLRLDGIRVEEGGAYADEFKKAGRGAGSSAAVAP